MRPFLSVVLNVDIAGEPNTTFQNLATSACESSFTTNDVECSTDALAEWKIRILLPRSTYFPSWSHTLMYSMSYLA